MWVTDCEHLQGYIIIMGIFQDLLGLRDQMVQLGQVAFLALVALLEVQESKALKVTQEALA